MFGCMRIVAIFGIAAIRNSSVIQTLHSLFGIAENSVNLLFLQKVGIATNPKCEEREKIFISQIFTNTVTDMTKLTPLLSSPRHDNSFEIPQAYLFT